SCSSDSAGRRNLLQLSSRGSGCQGGRDGSLPVYTGAYALDALWGGPTGPEPAPWRALEPPTRTAPRTRPGGRLRLGGAAPPNSLSPAAPFANDLACPGGTGRSSDPPFSRRHERFSCFRGGGSGAAGARASATGGPGICRSLLTHGCSGISER